ncbi:MAG: malectin domain-containing carbohydrate-binding protein [Bryobacteraceae bacterium]
MYQIGPQLVRAFAPRLLSLVFLISAAVSPAAAQAVRINCNSTQNYTAVDGTVWSPDRYWVDGGLHWTSYSIEGADDQAIYRGSRRGVYTPFSYDIPVPNGSLEVTLKFSENEISGAGNRVFHVDANGQRMLANFDIFKVAGGAYKAVDRTFTVNVTGGRLRLDFVSVVRHAMVSAIEIIPGAGATAPAPSPVTLSLTPTSATVSPGGQATFKATVSGSTDSRVTWVIAGPGTISNTGVYTAPPSIATTQQATIKATSVADNSKFATAVVTVVTPVSISVSPATATVSAGGTAQFTATVLGTADSRVTWSASAGSIDSSGRFLAPTVTSTTAVTITARSIADATKAATAGVTVNPVAPASPIPTPTPTTGDGAFLESGGMVVMEAENARVVNRTQSWIQRTNVPSFSGAGFMSAEPNSNNNLSTGYVASAPQLQFDVKFSQTGTYYVWARGYGATAADDSVHFGLDGASVASGEALSQFPVLPPSWAWSNQAMDNVRRVTLVIGSAGVHTINVFMREDGFRLDKVILAKSSSYTPTGTGPGESPREGSSDPDLPRLTLSNTSLSFTATAGGSNPAAQPVAVSNTGGGTLNWAIASGDSWVVLSPASASGKGSFSVRPSIGNLTAGTYHAKVTVTAAGAVDSPQDVEVTLNVAAASAPAAPVLSVNPASLSMTATAGGSATAQQATASFSGGAVGWTATDNQTWLSVSPTSGSGSGTLTVTANPSGLTAGTYTGVVTVTAAGAQNSPDTISVSFTVSAAPSAPSGGTGRNFYVSTTGSSGNDGSLAKPWDFVSAMQNKSVRPGDTIWIRGGTYGDGVSDVYVKLVGSAAAPIVVRNYPGENAKIQYITIVGCCSGSPNPANGSYVWLWGLEFTSPITDRTGCATGPPCYASSAIKDALLVFGDGVKVINCVIHDARQGLALWKEATGAEAYGNLIFNNGFVASDRGHGHGIYSQNQNGIKKITDNILFNGFGFGIHLYGSGSAWVKNYTVEGNVAFNSGALEGGRSGNIIVAGGADGNRGMIVKDNHFYNYPHDVGYAEIGWPWSSGNGDGVITGNYFIGGVDAAWVVDYQTMQFSNNTLLSPLTQVWMRAPYGTGAYNWNNNRYYGADRFRYGSTSMPLASWRATAKVDQNSTVTASNPTGVWTAIRPNRCEAGRSHIVVYNWSNQSSVAVNLSGVLTPGSPYEIRDAQNFFGPPVVKGTYAGGNVNIPMNQTAVAQPNGRVPSIPPHTSPRFGVFVTLVPGSSSRTCF